MSLPETLAVAPAIRALQKIAFGPAARASRMGEIPPRQEAVEGLRESRPGAGSAWA